MDAAINQHKSAGEWAASLSGKERGSSPIGIQVSFFCTEISRPLFTTQTSLQVAEFLVGDGAKEGAVHPLFCEMSELVDGQWKEAARCVLLVHCATFMPHDMLHLFVTRARRWVKYEESVEASGSRWSKPHVASLGFTCLMELHHALAVGPVLLDVPCASLAELSRAPLLLLFLLRFSSSSALLLHVQSSS